MSGKYVMVATSSHGSWVDYYMGKTYIHQGEYWAATGGRNEAKVYSSRVRAVHAAEALSNKVGRTFIVEELL